MNEIDRKNLDVCAEYFQSQWIKSKKEEMSRKEWKVDSDRKNEITWRTLSASYCRFFCFTKLHYINIQTVWHTTSQQN